MGINRISSLIQIAKMHRYHLALLLSCSLICFMAFMPVIGDIDVTPGQSLAGQLGLLVNLPSGAQITITPPQDISGWQINPVDINNMIGTLNVRANKNGWQVTAMDSDSITSGHMTDWTRSAYGSLKMSNPMKVKAANEVILPKGGVIQTGNKTSGHGQDINVIFIQQGSLMDAPLPVGHFYHIIVTFTGSYS